MDLQMLIAIVASGLLSDVNSVERCPKGWDTLERNCFFSSSYRLNWESARQTCKRLDPRADLASLHGEQQHIVFARSMRSYLWTGLNSLSSSGSWEWSDQSSVDFTRWKGGEPNTPHTKRCSTLYLEYAGIRGSEGYMISEECGKHLHYICQLRSVFCPPRWEHYNGVCYILPNELRTWDEAKTECATIHEGAQLASIHSDEQLSFFVERMYVRQWIGLKSKNGQQWEWSDGSPVGYNRVMPNVAEGGGKQCAELWSYKLAGLNWKSANCQELRHFLCKYRMSGETGSPLKPLDITTQRPVTNAPFTPYQTPPPSTATCPAVPSLPPGIAVECYFRGRPTSCQQPLSQGTTAIYKCDRFYEGSGETVTCDGNGEWSLIDGALSCNLMCGVKTTPPTISLILGGSDARRGEWPWHAGIYVQIKGQWDYHCGGTLVSERAVLTAAHCVVLGRSVETMAPKNMMVGLGKYYRQYDAQESSAQLIEVDRILVYEYYNPSSFDSDIAIVILKTPAQINPLVRPACFPLGRGTSEEDQALKPGSLGVLVGWGTTDRGELATELQIAELPYVHHQECRSSLEGTEKSYVRESNYCVGFQNGTRINSCRGDSGGGMMFPVGSGSSKRYFLYGITSFGISTRHEACDPTKFTFFTRVSVFSHWIVRKLSDI